MRVGAEAKQFIEAKIADGERPITPEHMEGWDRLTEEEQRAALLRRFREDEAGVRVQGPVRQPPAAPDAADPDTFDPDAPEAILTGRSERYRMPNGKWVHIHPCSLEESTVINAQAIRVTAERRGLGGLEDRRWDTPELSVERRLRAQVMQVIHCCRKGPEITSPLTFDPLKHTEWLMREPGYVDAIQEIAAISNALGQGAAESALLKEAMIGFFARAQSWAETWHGRLSADSGPTSLPDFCDVLEDFAASASSMKQPEALCPEAWFAWQLILRDAEPAPEPAEV